jgi:hypothetical protein
MIPSSRWHRAISMSLFTCRFLGKRLQNTPSTLFLPKSLQPSKALKFHYQKHPFTSFTTKRSLHDANRPHRAFVVEQLGEEATRPISLRPLFVGVGICLGAFLAAEFLDGRDDARFFAILRKAGWSGGNLIQATRFVAETQTKETLEWLDRFPGTGVVKGVYYTFQHWWINLHGGYQVDGTHAAAILIAANMVVFLGWNLAARSPRLVFQMSKSFMHFPGYTAGYTLLSSVFSHRVRIPDLEPSL